MSGAGSSARAAPSVATCVVGDFWRLGLDQVNPSSGKLQPAFVLRGGRLNSTLKHVLQKEDGLSHVPQLQSHPELHCTWSKRGLRPPDEANSQDSQVSAGSFLRWHQCVRHHDHVCYPASSSGKRTGRFDFTFHGGQGDGIDLKCFLPLESPSNQACHIPEATHCRLHCGAKQNESCSSRLHVQHSEVSLQDTETWLHDLSPQLSAPATHLIAPTSLPAALCKRT